MICKHDKLTRFADGSYRCLCEEVTIEPVRKPEPSFGIAVCCGRDPCKCGKRQYKSLMCRHEEHERCVKCPCSCHGEKGEYSPKPKDPRASAEMMRALYTLEDAFNKDHDEEREFRKALLDYLELPNLGNRGEHLSFGELTAKQYELRKFL